MSQNKEAVAAGIGTIDDYLQANQLSYEALVATGLNRVIDHTLLKPDATEDMIEQLIQEAVKYQFYSVCIAPYWVKKTAKSLAHSPVHTCTVIGFPLGNQSSLAKQRETDIALEDGAQEIDMVLNIGALKSGFFKAVEDDVRGVSKLCGPDVLVKVILETCLLSPEEIKQACEICLEAGAQFVKTSTGFSKAGASLQAVEIMRQAVGKQMGVKASGGISSRYFALQLMESGATRIGTSSGPKLLSKELKN